VVADGLGFGFPDEEWRPPPTILTGWRAFVDAAPGEFTLLPDEQWKELDPTGRLAYDEARMNYHSGLQVVATSTVTEVARRGSS
jgi:hypothetical protein